MHNPRRGPRTGVTGPWQALGQKAGSGQDIQAWFHAAPAARAGPPRGSCDRLTYHTLQCAAQHRHQDCCPGVSWVHLCPGAWLGDGAILSSVGKHQSQGLADPRPVGRWLPCVPGIKEKEFVSFNCPQLRATGASQRGSLKANTTRPNSKLSTGCSSCPHPDPSPGTGHLLLQALSARVWLMQQREPWILLKSHPQGHRDLGLLLP
uniref:Uncharacterized protein n=1 Tax=Pipistrellus kuhlii TaxID=59472 RepID=A0A7J8B271_PIPKU|nr:hypothetical protein mPipKuh1_007675 [Pipistrellus kuhlii]